MPVTARKLAMEGMSAIPATSHSVMFNASGRYSNLCGALMLARRDNADVSEIDKNGGPSHLQAWREFKGMTQAELADRVGTSQHMISFLESGERGLSAKWLRKLAPALETTPGLLLDYDPSDLPEDWIAIYASASDQEQRQILKVVAAIVDTDVGGSTDVRRVNYSSS